MVPGPPGSPESDSVVEVMTRKARPKQEWFTVAFLSREGMAIPFERLGKIVFVLHDKNYERMLIQEIEDAMRQVGGEFGAPAQTYATGIWPGKISKADLEAVRPRFYVHEGGHTSVVT